MTEEEAMNFEAPRAIKRMLFSTWALLDSLSPDLRAQMHIPDMHDPRRNDWDFIPKPDRTGVPLTNSTTTRRPWRTRCSPRASACVVTARSWR
ncbi:hypothetical protein [Cryptosporangium sp. NPDC048952]|uniref:hypothetical protein n=1 Tax=Cryptosporangium sp. NPDC048952 TaxID=3363961 RepID=UPI00371038B5